MNIISTKLALWCPPRLLRKEKITTLPQAKPWLTRFLNAMSGLPLPETRAEFHRSEAKTFLASGPAADLDLQLSPDPVFSKAALPNLSLATDEHCYIQPVDDNLIGLQFRVISPLGLTTKKYLFDAQSPVFFSPYTYASGELVMFNHFNKNLVEQLGPADRTTRDGAITAFKELMDMVIGGERIDRIPNILFPLAGPARSLNMTTPKGRKFSFISIHLEPAEIYWFRLSIEKIPGSENRTIAVAFSAQQTGRPLSLHYFLGPDHGFQQILIREADRQKRFNLPPIMRPRVWDDEEEYLTFL